MLQQILKDMYIDPDVLEALNEDQKKILFLKMRQEQVRRWQEHEDKLERESSSPESTKPKPKKAHGKSVSWSLGRDGDVQVIVIGETDEFKTSKIIYSGLGERKAANLLNSSCNQTTILKSNIVNRKSADPVKNGRENIPLKTTPGIQLNLKENGEELKSLPPLQVSVPEQRPSSLESGKQSVSHQPKELKEGSFSGTAEDNTASICYRPHLRSITTAAPTLQQTQQKKTTSLPATSRPQPHELAKESLSSREFRVVPAFKRGLSEETTPTEGGDCVVGRGRVAQLTKTFSVANDTSCTQTQPRANKPPIPAKPSHLRFAQSPSLR
ncbi:SH2 domain-containing protein 4A [Chanos chanos]|uniref:SH2 domain-containing protein 4A n=1 Tax=Chanos chanos TaxID=29144 RepID=A0A6J2W406_CHACN|nr:SH2 domain-containing protein 4A-like [Chanos chanos]